MGPALAGQTYSLAGKRGAVADLAFLPQFLLPHAPPSWHFIFAKLVMPQFANVLAWMEVAVCIQQILLS